MTVVNLNEYKVTAAREMLDLQAKFQSVSPQPNMRKSIKSPAKKAQFDETVDYREKRKLLNKKYTVLRKEFF